MRGDPHLAVEVERELEAPPPPSAAAEAEGFGDIISPDGRSRSVLVLGPARRLRSVSC